MSASHIRSSLSLLSMNTISATTTPDKFHGNRRLTDLGLVTRTVCYGDVWGLLPKTWNRENRGQCKFPMTRNLYHKRVSEYIYNLCIYIYQAKSRGVHVRHSLPSIYSLLLNKKNIESKRRIHSLGLISTQVFVFTQTSVLPSLMSFQKLTKGGRNPLDLLHTNGRGRREI